MPGKRLDMIVYGVPKAKQMGKPIPLLKCNGCKRQSSARPCKHCGSGDMIYLTSFVSNPTEVKMWENLVSMTTSARMLEAGVTRMEGPIKVTTRLYFPIAKTRLKQLKEGDWHLQRPDVDNTKKSCLDGIRGVAFADDCQVCHIEVTKHWTNGTPRAEIQIEEIAPEGER